VQWVGVISVLVTVITGVVTLVHPGTTPSDAGQTHLTQPSPSPSVSPSPEPVPTPTPTLAASLQVVGPMRVHNPTVQAEQVGEAVRQSRESMPTIEVALLNTAEQRVVLTTARFIVLGYGLLEVCAEGLGAPLEISATYDVVLPLDPPGNFVVDVPISQQLGGDEADRVAFRLGNPRLGPTVPTGYLFLLQVQLLYGPDQSVVDAGEALVSLPGTPSAGWVGRGELIDGEFSPGLNVDEDCVWRNSGLLADMISGDVAVAPELVQLAADLASPGASEVDLR
jgi:hypothetical protein